MRAFRLGGAKSVRFVAVAALVGVAAVGAVIARSAEASGPWGDLRDAALAVANPVVRANLVAQVDAIEYYDVQNDVVNYNDSIDAFVEDVIDYADLAMITNNESGSMHNQLAAATYPVDIIAGKTDVEIVANEGPNKKCTNRKASTCGDANPDTRCIKYKKTRPGKDPETYCETE